MTDFIERYVKIGPPSGEAYAIGAAAIHTFLKKYLSVNNTALSTISAIHDEKNGREWFKLIKEYYEGVGINAIDITKVEIIYLICFILERNNHICGGNI